MSGPVRRYDAMIWVSEDVPGERVSVVAEDLEDAKARLEKRYGVGTVFNLRNERDAQRPR